MKREIPVAATLALLFACRLGLPVSAHADLVSLRDCEDRVRAMQEIEAGSVANVAVQLVAAKPSAEGAGSATLPDRVSISDEASGAVRATSVKNSEARFRDLPAGDWKLCADGVAFSDIRFTSLSPTVDRDRTAIFGAGLAGLGGTAAAIALGSRSGGSDDTSSGSVVSASATVGGDIATEPAPMEPSAPSPRAMRNDVGGLIDGSAVDSAGCSKSAALSGSGCRNEESPGPLSPYN